MHHQQAGKKPLIVLGMCGLLGVFTSPVLYADDADARSIKHPLIGYWESKMQQSGCLESYWFREDGKAVFTSGDEQLEARYEVTPQPDAQGFFKLTHRVTLSNRGLECTRQTSETNTEQTSYVLFQPDGRSFIACDNDDPSLEACFGPVELKNNAGKSLR